jgi:hypothetical protein
VLLVVVFFTGIASAQSLEERLQTMVAKNAEMYVNPLVTAFGSGMNSGWFHSAKPHKLLGFDIGARAMVVTFPDDQLEFNFDVSDLPGINITETIGTSSYSFQFGAEDLYPRRTVPTFFGESGEGQLGAATADEIKALIEAQLLEQGMSQSDLGNATIQNTLADISSSVDIPNVPMAPGTGLDFLPLIVPQAAIGLSLPTLPIKAELIIRGLPDVEISEEIGKFSFMGGGAKLALDPFIPIPMFPVNIAVGAYTQKMALGDVLEANNTLVSLMVGKNMNLLVFGVGVYGAVGVESSNIKLKYDLVINEGTDEEVTTPIKFDMEGENKFRTTVGASVKLATFNISADYSMGADNVVTVGAGLSIR